MKKASLTMFLTICLIGVSSQCLAATHDADSALWKEVKATNLLEDYEAYISQYPNGKFVVLAKNRIKKLQSNPASANQGKAQEVMPVSVSDELPQLPYDLDEDVLLALKSSGAYRGLPRAHAVNVSFQTETADIVYTGSKVLQLANNKDMSTSYSESISREITPFGDHCSAHRVITHHVGNGKYDKSDSELVSYKCGLVSLGDMSGGKPLSIIKSLHVDGSLFPLKIGAEQNSITTSFNPAFPTLEQTLAKKCRVVSKGMASDLDARLTGASWNLSCESFVQMNGITLITSSKILEDYFLESLGIFLSDIGAYDPVAHKWVLPSPGSRITIDAPGDYGSRRTTTYQNIDLSFNK